MASEPAPALKKITLPVSVVTPSDVGRLEYELEVLENDLVQLNIQKSAHGTPVLAFSRGLERFAELNRLNLSLPDDRQTLKVFLMGVKQRAPILHISFNSEP